jgi:probable rRNA maturation factor
VSAAAPALTIQRASRAAHIPTDRQLRAWARAAAELTMGKPNLGSGSVTVRYVAEAEARRLNREFRGKDYATNVLSFPHDENSRELRGDIVICAAVVAKEARAQGKPVAAHHAHLLVHGLLHLAGYDHERGGKEARAMERRERLVLAKLGFPDPY